MIAGHQMERAAANREAEMVALGVTPEFEALRTDDRFKRLMRRVGIPGMS